MSSLYIIMMGVQGAGKGVQAEILSTDYNIPQISTGDLFRAMRGRTDALALEIKEILDSGKLVPDEITNKMVAERLAQPDAANGAILDGFPRNEAQAQWLDEHLASLNSKLTAVLWMELDLYTAFRRAFGRIKDLNGKTHNIYFDNDDLAEWSFENHPEESYPPRLVGVTKDGSPLRRRGDDANAHAIITRIDTYMEQTAPLLAYYKDLGLVISVNADQSIDAVTAEIKEKIQSRISGA